MHIRARVQANAKKDSIREITPAHFEVTVREKAAENRANHRTIELLAVHLGVPADKIRLVSGHHRPSKTFDVGSR